MTIKNKATYIMALKHITNQLHPLSYYSIHNAQLPLVVCRGANVSGPHGRRVVQGFGNWIKILSPLADIVKGRQLSVNEVTSPRRFSEDSPGPRQLQLTSLLHSWWQAAEDRVHVGERLTYSSLLWSSPLGPEQGHKGKKKGKLPFSSG